MDIARTGWSPSTPEPDPKSTPSDVGKQDFLNLLIAQLGHQDPLNPADSAEFMSQLAQFTSIEQLMQVNARLDTLALAQAATSSTSAAGLIGRTVTASGDRLTLGEEGGVDVACNLPVACTDATVTIKDESGRTVRTLTLGDCQAGPSQVTWDGMDSGGKRLKAGQYTFTVQGTGVDGKPVEGSGRMTGVVTGVNYDKGYPELLIGDQRIALGNVTEIR